MTPPADSRGGSAPTIQPYYQDDLVTVYHGDSAEVLHKSPPVP